MIKGFFEKAKKFWKKILIEMEIDQIMTAIF